MKYQMFNVQKYHFAVMSVLVINALLQLLFFKVIWYQLKIGNPAALIIAQTLLSKAKLIR